MSDKKDEFGYDKLGAVELRKVISDLVREAENLNEEKREFNGAINENLKSIKTRVKRAVELLTATEKNVKDSDHEFEVAKILKSVPSV